MATFIGLICGGIAMVNLSCPRGALVAIGLAVVGIVIDAVRAQVS